MKFKYRLPQSWIEKIVLMEEFANGATQVSIRIKGGVVIKQVLVSDATYLIAARGYQDLPFALDDIEEIFQSAEDKNPTERGNWEYWDNWHKNP